MDRLNEETRLTQIPDLGSIIGETVAKWAKHTPEEIDDFVDSFSHGVSLATGTHDRNEENEFVYVKKCYIKDLQREYHKMGCIVIFEAVIISVCALALVIL